MGSSLGGKWSYDPITGQITESPTREAVLAQAEAAGNAAESDDDVLERLIREVVRAELRRVGLRPPMPSEYGTFRWNAATDAWERSDG